VRTGSRVGGGDISSGSSVSVGARIASAAGSGELTTTEGITGAGSTAVSSVSRLSSGA
jgi:hypothetical protein